jgi:hypothetical protein
MCMKYHASTKISNTIQEGGTKTKRILKMNSDKKLFKRWSNITFEGLFTYIFTYISDFIHPWAKLNL